MSIKDALQKILPSKDRVEQIFPQKESIFKLGLRDSPLDMEWAKVNGEVFDTSTSYLKSVDRRKNRPQQNTITSYFDSHAFRQAMEGVADKHQHTNKKVHSDKGSYYQVFNGPEHYIDYDLNGNCVFLTRDYKSPALKEYVEQIAERYKKNNLYIVYNVSNPDLSKQENEEFLRLITKTLVDSGIEFGRLQIANPTFRHVLDSMSPSKPPLHMVYSNGEFVPSPKIYDKNSKDDESVLVHKGLRFVEISGGKLKTLMGWEYSMEKEHNLRIRFENKGDIIIFDSADGKISTAFKTETLKNGEILKAEVAGSSGGDPWSDSGQGGLTSNCREVTKKRSRGATYG